MSDSATLELPCLGLPFQLGMLYDCRRDALVPGITLWDEKQLNIASSEKPQPSSNFEIIAEDSIKDKMFSLGVEGSLSLSLVGGLVSVSGSAKFVHDRKSSKNTARVSLKYSCTSKFQQLTMEQLATTNIQYPDVFDKGTATHVVTAVLYGVEAFFIFDREVSQGENYRDIHGRMEVLIKAMPTIVDIGGSADVGIKKAEKTETEKFQCKFYGDVILDKNPATFQQAVEVYQQLPKHFRSTTVPKKVWLYPLSALNSKAARMVKEISTSLVTQTQQIIEGFHVVQMRSADLIKSRVCEYFTSFREQLSKFQEMVNEYKIDFMKKLCNVLPNIRGGGAEEQDLADLIGPVQNSPFEQSLLSAWLNHKEGEFKVLSQYLSIMEKVNGATLAFVPGDVDSAINNTEYDYVLSFEFKVAKKIDSFLQSMYSMLHTKASVGGNFQSNFSNPWFKPGAIIKDLRIKAKQFTSFAEGNKNNKNIKFIITDTSDDDSSAIESAAAIVLYAYGLRTEFEFEPPSQPRKKPVATDISHEKIHLTWKQPEFGTNSIKHYTVLYRTTSDKEWREQKTEEAVTSITIHQLAPETKYIFKVRAECDCGFSQESEVSDIIETKPPPVSDEIQTIISQSTIYNTGPPTVYKISTSLVCYVGNIIEKRSFGKPHYPPKPTRVLMVVGATGAGKSTLINGMVNYMLGVKLEDNFRFKLICDEVTQSQAHSQTQMVTAYTFYWHKGSPLDYNITIIDTPGFGDTRGLKRDKEITDIIREFFQIKGKHGLDELHAIGFVTQASLARLTITQKYISDSILSIFGKDIEHNIFIMTTFADGAYPPVMAAVKEANIPHAKFFPFNNSALFVDPSKSEFSKTFWEMGYASLNKFLSKLGMVDGVSLQLTRQVLEERKQLETVVLGLQPQIDAGLSKIDEIRQEEQEIKRRESEILANKDFKYKVTVPKQRMRYAPKGTYVTTCAECHFTCHDNCIYDNDHDKWKCSAMNSGGERSATCRVCPGNCSWRKHFNNGYIFELYQEVEERTSEDLLKRYKDATSAKASVEAMVHKAEQELQMLHQAVLYNIREARRCLKRLDEIALKPNPLTEVEYIDLLIESEKQQKKEGWENRVKYFREVRQQAEILSNVKDKHFNEELAKQNAKILWDKIANKFQNIASYIV